jgi:16S rRNA C967 or C1407 C5-methylase (RsmB/RsmF family)
LGHTLERLGVVNAVVTGYQAQEFPLKAEFDYVLADVPCSGEGTLREALEGLKVDGGASGFNLKETQRRILLRAFDLLKEDGVLLYATCTYNPDENESVVQFLLKNREAELLPMAEGFHSEPGLRKWKDTRYDEELRKAARFYPHRLDSVGFFMARIGRRRGSP